MVIDGAEKLPRHNYSLNLSVIYCQMCNQQWSRNKRSKEMNAFLCDRSERRINRGCPTGLCISSMIYRRNIPFWSEALEIFVII